MHPVKNKSKTNTDFKDMLNETVKLIQKISNKKKSRSVMPIIEKIDSYCSQDDNSNDTTYSASTDLSSRCDASCDTSNDTSCETYSDLSQSSDSDTLKSDDECCTDINFITPTSDEKDAPVLLNGTLNVPVIANCNNGPYYLRLPCKPCGEVRIANPHLHDLRIITEKLVKNLNSLGRRAFINNSNDGTIHLSCGAYISLVSIPGPGANDISCSYWGLFGCLSQEVKKNKKKVYKCEKLESQCDDCHGGSFVDHVYNEQRACAIKIIRALLERENPLTLSPTVLSQLPYLTPPVPTATPGTSIVIVAVTDTGVVTFASRQNSV